MKTDEFQELLWQKGSELYRDMPWRRDTRPYYVLVSEIMLQQTQVDRVIPKFLDFITTFPDEKALARAPLSDVLKLWSGLGYNRRAKYLHEAAKATTKLGKFPNTLDELIKLPGVGKNTAGAIMAYAFNQPAYFIETNVRAVYIHHFFEAHDTVDDKQIMEKLQLTLDKENPREFYQALMDYGSWLKRQGAVKAMRSRQYKRQAPLKGSLREMRGQIVRALTENDLKIVDLQMKIAADERFLPALEGLKRDGLVTQKSAKLHLTN